MMRKAVNSVMVDRPSKREKETGSLNLRSLKKIITIMNRAKITELDIEQDGLKIHLRKGPASGEMITTVTQPPTIISAPSLAIPITPTPGAVVAPAAVAVTPATPPPAAAEEANWHTIVSPMVGTFYRAPSPEANPYVEIGTVVDENTVVCIVEAMKLMNEIKAEVKGEIKKILVENAQAVEYGQPLFMVERRV